VIGWYRLRWHIEQLVFEPSSVRGLRIEQSVVEKRRRLSKSSLRSRLVAAAITMQLVLARLYRRPRPALPAACSTPGKSKSCMRLQKEIAGGRTTKQQNPHPPDSMAWAGWTIARLGGWTGYDSDKSRGPITIRDGLDRFYGHR